MTSKPTMKHCARAYSYTYGAGINPEAVPELVAALEAIEASMFDHGHLRLGYDWINSAETEHAFGLMRAALALARISAEDEGEEDKP